MPDTWVLAGPARALAALEPLRRARAASGAVRCVTLPEDVTSASALRAHLAGARALLWITPRQLTPRQALPGLFLHDPAGRPVPAGCLPNLPNNLACYAQAAVRVAQRNPDHHPRGPLVLLGQWEDRTLRLARQTLANFADTASRLPIFRWTAERIMRQDMLAALRAGPGIALYFGHARPRGWAGYHGVRAHHLPEALGEPLGVVLSLTCHTANRHQASLSFAESMALSGLCAASLGATRKTVHIENGFLAHKICRTLAGTSIDVLGDLLLQSDLTPAECAGDYRIIGDPLANLRGAREALEQCRSVFAPAPEDALPPWDTDAAQPRAA